MKKLMLWIMVLSMNTGVVSAQQSKRKLQKARENVKEAKAEVKQAQNDSIQEYKQFRIESLERIERNKGVIAELKRQHAEKDHKTDSIYKNRISQLEKKNSDLNSMLIHYKADGNTDWIVFKRDFTEALQALEQSFVDSREE